VIVLQLSTAGGSSTKTAVQSGSNTGSQAMMTASAQDLDSLSGVQDGGSVPAACASKSSDHSHNKGVLAVGTSMDADTNEIKPADKVIAFSTTHMHVLMDCAYCYTHLNSSRHAAAKYPMLPAVAT
jgi:hypothetical protein